MSHASTIYPSRSQFHCTVFTNLGYTSPERRSIQTKRFHLKLILRHRILFPRVSSFWMMMKMEFLSHSEFQQNAIHRPGGSITISLSSKPPSRVTAPHSSTELLNFSMMSFEFSELSLDNPAAFAKSQQGTPWVHRAVKTLDESLERHSPGGFQEPTANSWMPRGARVSIASLRRYSAPLHLAWRLTRTSKRGFSDCGSSHDLRVALIPSRSHQIRYRVNWRTD